MLPKDPVILLSYVNTCLRDKYPSLESFAEVENVSVSEITSVLAGIDYSYDENTNQFT
ncbi:MAG: DUF4250 domain-containing protein [Lachnospiraceae bacterium]